ncbi:MAG TPA: hypothetical protein VF622_20005 [Segetibacter sp.]|jgi:hypothetical protein
MKLLSNYFIYTPGDENESGGISTNNSDNEKVVTPETLQPAEVEKPLSKKIHDALQQWSNDDQRDQNIDDSTP